MSAEPGNLDRLVQVYGPATWDVYDQLDVTLDPAGSDSLFHDAADLVEAGWILTISRRTCTGH